ncbi:MAG: SLC13 family permease [Gammaproteobacteria bacterium]|nr:SLC13 family permease [Gammaproteobacteria bacterium]
MSDQTLVFLLISTTFVLFVWGKVRYDMVAFSALVAGTLIGVIPTQDVFSGFGHPAVIIIALVLIISRGLVRSGSVELISSKLAYLISGVKTHIAVMGTVSAMLSSIVNNVAALAILMPADTALNKKANRKPSATLMALAFTSILGGMVTMIGTASNVVIATYRESVLETPYTMFDFAPVGLIVALSGVIFIALFGWRLMPSPKGSNKLGSRPEEVRQYVSNVVIAKDSNFVGQYLSHLDDICDEANVSILGLIRNNERLEGEGFIRNFIINVDDLLILEGSVQGIDEFMKQTKTHYISETESDFEFKHTSLIEAVAPPFSRSIGRSATQLSLLKLRQISLLGISRSGRSIIHQVRKTKIQPGDVLLLHGDSEHLESAVQWMECLTLERKDLQIPQRKKSWMAVLSFLVAIIASSLGYINLPIALSLVVVFYIAANVIPTIEVYRSISWPVIVLLGAMIPIGEALQSSGGAETISNSLLYIASGASPVVILTMMLLITILLSAVLNNVATVLVAAPIGLEIAKTLGVNPDTFLMAVAIGASCAFLTPIGHQNNTLVMGPGGYRFGDYWKLGLPLEIIITIVAVPALLYYWPLETLPL